MGTDFHGVFQRRTAGGWADIPTKYDGDRHYQLFAVLAGVRNGYGFAGVQNGQRLEPIAPPRGFPPDFELAGDCHPVESVEFMFPHLREYREPGDRLEIWMGDHSYSWLTADEILEWAKRAPVVVKVGVLSREVYESWDGKSRPLSYSGGVFGGLVLCINDNEVEKKENPNWTHIRCTWDQNLKDELAYFFDEVARLRDEHGEVRFVFGFDS